MTVYRLSPACDVGDVEEGKVYVVRVQGFADFGTFVYLNDRIKGLIHKSNVKTRHQEGETVFVRVRQIRKNGNIDLEEIVPTRYNTETVAKKLTVDKNPPGLNYHAGGNTHQSESTLGMHYNQAGGDGRPAALQKGELLGAWREDNPYSAEMLIKKVEELSRHL